VLEGNIECPGRLSRCQSACDQVCPCCSHGSSMRMPQPHESSGRMTAFFGPPDNPIAAAMAFHSFVIPYLTALGGLELAPPKRSIVRHHRLESNRCDKIGTSIKESTRTKPPSWSGGLLARKTPLTPRQGEGMGPTIRQGTETAGAGSKGFEKQGSSVSVLAESVRHRIPKPQ
jgi:hypothetical protein